MLKAATFKPLAVLLAGSAPAAASCRALAPAAVAGGTARWLGPCRNGVAEGVGTLRITRKSAPPTFFFGRMMAGRPFSGVMPADGEDWRPVWRFDPQLRPRAHPDGDRQASIDTFRLAAAGAAEASRRYRAAGNLASARFYADQSRRLAEAMD